MSKKKKNLKSQIPAPASIPGLNTSPFKLNMYQNYFPSQFSGKSNLSLADAQIMIKLKHPLFHFDTETGVCSGFDDYLIKAKENADAEKKQIMEAINLECASKVNAEKKKKRL